MNVTLLLTLPKTISLNSLYSGKHWTFRKKKKDEYKTIVEGQLANYPYYSAQGVAITIRYNSRLDVDNNVLVSKFVADTLVFNKYIPDDGPKYYQRLVIVFDKEVKRDHCEVAVELLDAVEQ